MESAVQRTIDAEPGVEVVQQLSEPVRARIAAATVSFDRSGAPVSALVIADVSHGVRAYARSTDPELIVLVTTGEPVGEAVLLRPVGDGTHDVALVG